MSLFIANNKMMSINGIPLVLPEVEAFTFKIDTTKGNGFNTFTLPLTNHFTDVYVKTSDGQRFTISNYLDAKRIINFASAGVYTIELRGECGWSFSNTGDCQKLIEIKNWGNLKFNNLLNGFYGCINLTSLPLSGSINGSTLLTLENCFANCRLQDIGNKNIFNNCKNVISFVSTFHNNKLTSIPSGLFKYNIKVTNFAITFQQNQLTSIPAGLFDYCTLVTNFHQTFYNNQLTSIPSGLFDYCTLVTNFYGTFSINQLTSIPSGLFKYNINVTNFKSTFATNQLTSIPADLYKYNINVTYFDATFYNNQLTSIPSRLFDYCTLVTTFYATFQQNQLTSIPSGLFKYNIKVTNFQSTFYNNQLTSIPENLFINNTAVTIYDNTFMNALASGCTMPSVMFNLTQIAKVTVWTNMFNQSSTTNSPIGTVQDIWNYASPTATKTDCFNKCTQLTNYTSIPVDWI